MLPVAVCRRFDNRDVQPHRSGSAESHPAGNHQNEGVHETLQKT